MEFEHVHIYQRLEDIFEDVTALHGMFQYPLVQAVVGVICLVHLLRALAFGSLSLLLL